MNKIQLNEMNFYIINMELLNRSLFLNFTYKNKMFNWNTDIKKATLFNDITKAENIKNYIKQYTSQNIQIKKVKLNVKRK